MALIAGKSSTRVVFVTLILELNFLISFMNDCDSFAQYFGKSHPYWRVVDQGEFEPLPSGSLTISHVCLSPPVTPVAEFKYRNNHFGWFSIPARQAPWPQTGAFLASTPYGLPQGTGPGDRIGRQVAVRQLDVNFSFRCKVERSQFSTAPPDQDLEPGQILNRKALAEDPFLLLYNVNDHVEVRMVTVVAKLPLDITTAIDKVLDIETSAIGPNGSLWNPAFADTIDIIGDLTFSTPIRCIERCVINPVDEPVEWAQCPDKFGFLMNCRQSFVFDDPLFISFDDVNNPVDRTIVTYFYFDRNIVSFNDQIEYCQNSRLTFTDC